MNGNDLVTPMSPNSSEKVKGQVAKINDTQDLWDFLIDKQTGKRVTIHGKPVILWDAKIVLNMESGFEHKLLCTGPTFNLGDACAYSCPFCYVEAATHGRFLKFLEKERLAFQDVVIRRKNALDILGKQLEKLSTKKRNFPHVAFSSTTVDIAANVELVKETADACILIFKMTKWEIRLLTKSNMLPLLVSKIPKKYHHRLIVGVSSGTFDDELAQAVETGTPLVSKRIESIRKLQDDGIRTYAMVCPSMPMTSTEEYEAFAQKAAELLRYDLMEHVWAESMNVRGSNLTRMIASLDSAGQLETRNLLAIVCGEGKDARERWEEYARATFEAHKKFVPAGKLRFLQYVNRDKDLPYWTEQVAHGAVILGTAEERAATKSVPKQDSKALLLNSVESAGVTAPVEPDTRDIVKQEINTIYGEMIIHGRITLEKAITIGGKLVEIKETLKHGEFGKWIDSALNFDQKTAERYMKLFSAREKLKIDTMSNISSGLRFLDEEKRAKKPKASTSPRADNSFEVESEDVEPQPQLFLMDKPVVQPDAASVELDNVKTITPAFDIVTETELPVLVMRASEEVIAASLKEAVSLCGNIEHQIIRVDGQVKLNAYFLQRLGLAAA